MHQPVGQIPIGGKQHQSTGVDIQTADINPALPAYFWQMIKDRWPPFRIITGTDFAHRFVVHQHTAAGAGIFKVDLTAIHADFIETGGLIAQFCCHAIDRDPAVGNPAFNFAA